jgi:hypothetical protein
LLNETKVGDPPSGGRTARLAATQGVTTPKAR